jgi:predicted nuclease of predicted toxin-antitoxin system
MTKLMTQLTSIQLIEAAHWRELGSNEPQSDDVLHQALADAVSRWLLVRSESPDIDALKFVCRVKANIAQPERFL